MEAAKNNGSEKCGEKKTSVTIAGCEITCLSKFDGLPIKNQLPEELQKRLRTEIDWLTAEQMCPAEGEKPFEMHPTASWKKCYRYYLDSQMVKAKKHKPWACTEKRGRKDGRISDGT